MWKFLVKNQSIEILEREVLADKQIQYVQLKFTFDGEWKHFHKVVQFSQCDETYNLVLGTDGTSCYLPAELHVGAVKMSVFGYDPENTSGLRATTVPVTLNIRPSGFVGDDDDTPIPPTPDLYTQLLKKIEETTKGDPGKSAYELAVQEGYTGTLDDWLNSLRGADGQNGKDGITPDMSEYPKKTEVTAIVEDAVAPVAEDSHTHDNKAILDQITAPYTAEEREKLDALKPGDYATNDRLNEQISLVREEITPLENAAHSHKNKAALDAITADDVAEVQSLPAFKETTADSFLALQEAVSEVAGDSHQHDNKAVLDSITAIDKQLNEHSTNPVANYVLALAIDVLNVARHTHGNAGTLEKITEQMLADISGYGPFEDWTREQVHTLFEHVNNFSNTAHTHENKAVLDSLTSDLMALLVDLQQFEDSTNYSIQTIKESVDPVISQAHWHHNLTILNGITQAKINQWDSIADLKTQVSGLSSTLTVVKNKADSNADRLYADEATIDTMQIDLAETQELVNTMQETIKALQAEIDNMDGSKIQTIFVNGANTLERYAENVYTFYNDGYRALPGFVSSYPHFCNAENDYALSFNVTDFGWAGVVYAMFLTPVNLSSQSSIILNYQSGATDVGEIYLVEKITGRTYSELAQYVHDCISNGTAIKLNFQWLQSTDFISVLCECGDIQRRGYYVAIKGVSDNTRPILRSIKALGE